MEFQNKKLKQQRRATKALVSALLSERLRSSQEFDVEVVQTTCTNPACSRLEPHTFVYVNWSTGGSGSFVIPLSLSNIDKDVCMKYLPTKEVMTKWCNGIRAEWPERLALRFPLGAMVQCRTDHGWCYGKISCLYYSEEGWSPLLTAPYQVRLFNGCFVYAPFDSDDVIRLAVLRFCVGDRVHVNVNTRLFRGWTYGRVVKLFYYERGWHVSKVAAYQVMLHTGDLIYVPFDTDDLIQSRPEPPCDAPSSPLIHYEDFA